MIKNSIYLRIGIQILIIILILTLHLITNIVVFHKGWSLMQLFGFEISINLVYDLTLSAILILVTIEIFLLIKEIKD